MVVSRGTWRFSRESCLTQSCSRGWKLRLTFRLGNYIRSFSQTFGPQMKYIWTLTVFVFGPESVSYERSRRETGARIHHFWARVFFVKIPQSQYSMIYTILRFFRIHIPKMDSFPMLFSHPTRPPGRPSARHGSQVIRMDCFPVFPGSQVIKMVCFPIFPGS